MTRCAPALRSYAAGFCVAAALAVSVAACGGDGGDRLGTRTSTAPESTTAPSTTVAVVTPAAAAPATTVAPSTDVDANADVDVDIDDQLASIDTELAELDAALKEFDQITATTEGDPSQ